MTRSRTSPQASLSLTSSFHTLDVSKPSLPVSCFPSPHISFLSSCRKCLPIRSIIIEHERQARSDIAGSWVWRSSTGQGTRLTNPSATLICCSLLVLRLALALILLSQAFEKSRFVRLLRRSSLLFLVYIPSRRSTFQFQGAWSSLHITNNSFHSLLRSISKSNGPNFFPILPHSSKQQIKPPSVKMRTSSIITLLVGCASARVLPVLLSTAAKPGVIARAADEFEITVSRQESTVVRGLRETMVPGRGPRMDDIVEIELTR